METGAKTRAMRGENEFQAPSRDCKGNSFEVITGQKRSDRVNKRSRSLIVGWCQYSNGPIEYDNEYTARIDFRDLYRSRLNRKVSITF
jgi:hypothetical protein